MDKYRIFSLLLALLSLFTASCARKIYQVAYPTLSDNKYDTEFPYKSCSSELAKIVDTVRKINCTAYYEGYTFAPDRHIRQSDLNKKTWEDQTVHKFYSSASVAGTATVIAYSDQHLALLTCAHTVLFDDTLYVHKDGADKGKLPYLQSVAIKSSQTNYIQEFSSEGEMEILAIDTELDAAIIGMKLRPSHLEMVPKFKYPFGKARALEWGSFVYVIGYPMGYSMVTKGIVSSPNRNRQGGFLVDALFNEGMSGGLVLAVRDGVPNFELVGMATAVAADMQYVLVPPETGTYDPNISYQGPVYVKMKREINYGITHVVAIEEIANFIKRNHSELKKKGYDLSELFEK